MAVPNELIRIHDQHGERHYLNVSHIVEVAVRAREGDPPTARITLAAREHEGVQREIYIDGETATALLTWLDTLATTIPLTPPTQPAWGRQRDASGDMARPGGDAPARPEEEG